MPRRRDDDDASQSSSEGSGRSDEFSDEGSSGSGSYSGSGSGSESGSGSYSEGSHDEERALNNHNDNNDVDTTGFSTDLYAPSDNTHWRDAGKAYDHTLGIAHTDDSLNDSHSFPAEQLPSPEEAKTHNATQRGLGSDRDRLRHRKLFDPTVLIVVGTLSLMAGVFTFMFLWFPTAYYGDDDNNNKSNNAAPTPAPVAAPTPPPVNAMGLVETELRNNIALQGGVEFADPNSYQSRALTYLKERADDYLEHIDDERLGQVYALLCVFYLTNDNNSGGQSWRDTYQWLHSPNHCTWSGVTCNFLARVQRLDLTNAQLVASSLPAEMELLEEALQVLILDDNAGLTGSIPTVLGRLAQLQTLSLENTGYTGDVPANVCTLVEQTQNFNLEVDCDKVLCQETCCDGCY